MSDVPPLLIRKYTKSKGRHLVSRRASEIMPRDTEFLWDGRLARGKHTCIGGEPGTGKSQLTFAIAAAATTGGQWPCGEGRALLCGVIILNVEDDADDTIVPRLMAAGANLERVHIVSAVRDEDSKGNRTFNLQADLDLLEGKIDEIIEESGDDNHTILVIIDPVSSYLGGKTDSHKNAEVRGVLEPITELAARKRAAILSVTHFNKSSSGTTRTSRTSRRVRGPAAGYGLCQSIRCPRKGQMPSKITGHLTGVRASDGPVVTFGRAYATNPGRRDRLCRGARARTDLPARRASPKPSNARISSK
jgi:hypothetical protein